MHKNIIFYILLYTNSNNYTRTRFKPIDKGANYLILNTVITIQVYIAIICNFKNSILTLRNIKQSFSTHTNLIYYSCIYKADEFGVLQPVDISDIASRASCNCLHNSFDISACCLIEIASK